MRKGLLIWILALLLMATLWGCAAKSAGADTAVFAAEAPAAESQAAMVCGGRGERQQLFPELWRPQGDLHL